ncbi:leucine-rich repeat-containing protein 74B-like isoform X2 [Mytilus californianus]|uniref:leucine-rich repeat-containing protein 74B-like isoform X2 n=1 Tax=Mytilus californianus TaxID=6549 RepID=UPI002245C16C|nr:leucine-rich repeat-containing protein 74B-like isoform X2 [Mytilus californianus]
MTEINEAPVSQNSRQGRRTVTSASSRLRRSRRETESDPNSTENSRQNTKDLDIHDIPDEELREKRKQKLERPKVMQKMYEKACNRFKVVPVRQYWETPDTHTVSLPNYNLGTQGVQALATPLMLHDSITVIDLSGNDMGAKGVQSLVDALHGNTSLNSLNLAENKLHTAGAVALKEFLREHPTLQILSLSGNGFKDEDSIIFGQVMKENQRLQHVNFSHNEFAETAGLQFRYVLSDTENLETFDISWNHLRRKGAMDLLAGVKKNYGLRVLDVSFNGFAAEGAAVMANVLKKNRTLQEVDMRHNRLNDADIINIATKMDCNDSLKVLKLGENHFTHLGALALITVLLNPDNVIALELLDLGNTPVSDDFDFIANELKTSRQNLTIKYGRIMNMKKKLPQKQQISDNQDSNLTNHQQNESEVDIERSKTLPTMSSSAGTDVDDLVFSSESEAKKSALDLKEPSSQTSANISEAAETEKQHENNKTVVKEESITFPKTEKDSPGEESNLTLPTNYEEKQNVPSETKLVSNSVDKTKNQIDTNNSNIVTKENSEISSAEDKQSKKDETINANKLASQPSQFDPKNLFVLQRQTFIEKKPDD